MFERKRLYDLFHTPCSNHKKLNFIIFAIAGFKKTYKILIFISYIHNLIYVLIDLILKETYKQVTLKKLFYRNIFYKKHTY